MRILIVNDDGIKAEGLVTLANRLKAEHEIYVVAPDSECSGYSHYLHFHQAVSFTEVSAIDGCECYMLDGTPCDCAKFAIEKIMIDNPPDIVLSGINNGLNIGSDIIYSGTVNAAIEAGMCGIKALAISAEWRGETHNFSYPADFIAKNLTELSASGPKVLSINFPSKDPSAIKGVKYVKAGKNAFHDEYIDVPNEGKYGKSYILTGEEITPPTAKKIITDVDAVNSGFIAITPIEYEFTDFKGLDALKDTVLCM